MSDCRLKAFPQTKESLGQLIVRMLKKPVAHMLNCEHMEKVVFARHKGSRMVIPTGFEPVASGLGILRSILLSYGTSQRSN
jgi:hypothetical protein